MLIDFKNGKAPLQLRRVEDRKKGTTKFFKKNA
jgi:hypothetical protein